MLTQTSRAQKPESETALRAAKAHPQASSWTASPTDSRGELPGYKEEGLLKAEELTPLRVGEVLIRLERQVNRGILPKACCGGRFWHLAWCIHSGICLSGAFSTEESSKLSGSFAKCVQAKSTWTIW